jgi:hypothetical protein
VARHYHRLLRAGARFEAKTRSEPKRETGEVTRLGAEAIGASASPAMSREGPVKVGTLVTLTPRGKDAGLPHTGTVRGYSPDGKYVSIGYDSVPGKPRQLPTLFALDRFEMAEGGRKRSGDPTPTSEARIGDLMKDAEDRVAAQTERRAAAKLANDKMANLAERIAAWIKGGSYGPMPQASDIPLPLEGGDARAPEKAGGPAPRAKKSTGPTQADFADLFAPGGPLDDDLTSKSSAAAPDMDVAQLAERLGPVVFNGGDVFLVMSLSQLNTPIYLPVNAKGDYHTADVGSPSIQPGLFTAEQLARLRDAATALKAQHETEFQAALDTTFASENVVAFDGISDDMRNWVSRVMDALGLSSQRILIVPANAPLGAVAGRYGLVGKGFRLLAALRQNGSNVMGQVSYLKSLPGHYVITLDTSRPPGVQLETMGHELGHIVDYTMLANAPKETQDAIRAEFEAWLVKNGGRHKALADLYRSKMPLITGRYAANREQMRADRSVGDLSQASIDYQTAYDEWFADQVARWLSTDAKPRSLTERFFAELANLYRTLFEALGIKAKDYAASPAVQKFLNDHWMRVEAPSPASPSQPRLLGSKGTQGTLFNAEAPEEVTTQASAAAAAAAGARAGRAAKGRLRDARDTAIKILRLEDFADIYGPVFDAAAKIPGLGVLKEFRKTLELQGGVKHEITEEYQRTVAALEAFERLRPDEAKTLSGLVHNSTINNYNLDGPDLAASPLPSSAPGTKTSRAARATAWARDKAIYDQLTPGGKRLYYAIGKHGSDQAGRFKHSTLSSILYHATDIREQAATKFGIDFGKPADLERFAEMTWKDAGEFLANGPTSTGLRFDWLAVTAKPGMSKRVKQFVDDFPTSNYYFPEKRFGDYVATLNIEVELLKPSAADKQAAINALSTMFGRVETLPGDVLRIRHTSFHESSSAAQQARDTLSALIPKTEAEVRAQVPNLRIHDITSRVGEVRVARNEIWRGSDVALSDEAISELEREVEANALSRNVSRQAARAEAESMAQMLYDLKYRHSPEASFFKSMIARDGVLGAEPSLARALAFYSQGAGNLLGRMRYGGMADDLLSMMDDAANQKATGADAQKLSAVYNQIRERYRDAQQVDSTGPLTRNLMNLGYSMFLLTPVYWMQNALQNLVLTLPVLTAQHGASKASGALHAAQRHALSLKNFGKAFAAMGASARDLTGTNSRKLSDADIDRLLATVPSDINAVTDAIGASTRYKNVVIGGKPVDISGQMVEMLKTAMLRGKIDLTLGMSLAEMANDGKRGVLDKLSEMTRAVPQQIEVFNRASSAMASYELERRAGRTHAEAVEAALAVIDRSQVDYSAMNRPGWPPLQRYPLLRAVMMFKQYALAQYMLAGKALWQAYKGGNRKEALMLLGGLFASHAALGGVLNFMLAEPIKIAMFFFGAMFGYDDDDLERDFRNMLARNLGSGMEEVISKGIPRALGLDLSSRITPPSLLFSDQNTRAGTNDRLSDSVARFAGLTVLGPVGSLGLNALDSINHFREGDYYRAFEKITPAGVRNVVRTARFGTEGIMDTNGNVLRPSAGMSVGDLAAQAVGITPASAARLYERREAVRQVTNEMSGKRSALLEQYWRAGPDGRGAVRERVREYNARYPSNRIDPDDLRQSLRTRQRQQRDIQRGGGAAVPGSRRQLIDEQVQFGR